MLQAAAIVMFFVAGPPRPQEQAPSWLHPSENEIQFAIDQGYTLKPKVKFNVIEVGSGFEPVLQIVPPLSCAEQQGEDAARRLAAKPTVTEVETDFCHGLTVRYRANESGPKSTFAVLLIHGSDTLKPASSELDRPAALVPSYMGPRVQTVSSFDFDLPSAWQDKIQVRYSNGYNVATKTVNLEVFAKDEASHRAK